MKIKKSVCLTLLSAVVFSASVSASVTNFVCPASVTCKKGVCNQPANLQIAYITEAAATDPTAFTANFKGASTTGVISYYSNGKQVKENCHYVYGKNVVDFIAVGQTLKKPSIPKPGAFWMKAQNGYFCSSSTNEQCTMEIQWK